MVNAMRGSANGYAKRYRHKLIA